MPIDASIYGQFAPKVQSPLDVQNGLMQNAMAQGQLQQNALAIQQKQRDFATENALRQAVMASGGDPAALRQALVASGNAAALDKHDQTQADLAEKKARAGKEASQTKDYDSQVILRNIQGQREQTNLMAQQLGSAQTPQDVAALYQQHVQSGILDPQKAQASFDKMPKAPGPEFDAWKAGQLQQGLTIAQKQDQAMKQLEEQGRNTRNSADLANRIKVVGIQQAGENARQGNTIANSRVLAGLNPDGSPKPVAMGADGSIDLKQVAPEDLAAAYRYKTDGTLPSNMGKGLQGATESRRIRAIASALDAQGGDSPEDARIRQLAAKGDIAAVNKMRQREVAVGANVKNFDFNADQVLQLSGKVDRSGIPIANAWINAGRRSVTGNPDLSAFDTAIKTTVNEFAQIVSGTTSGATAEGEKKKAEALLNAQQTPEQIIATVHQMKIESQNRMASFKAQRAESMPTNGPKAAAAPASPGKVVHFGDLK